MNRHKTFQEQLEKALKDYERAIELEELTRIHSEINRQIRDKNKAAIEKERNGQIVTQAEQDEIYGLGKQQEEAHKKLVDKVLSR